MMLFAKLAWGITNAAIVGAHFRKAWKKEHGKLEEKTIKGETMTKDTYVWVNPTTFLWVLFILFIIYLFKCGIRGGLGVAVNTLLNLTAYFCVYFAVVMPLIPYLRRKISSRACATLWLCPIFMCYFIWYDEIGSYGIIHIYIPRRVLTIILAVWLVGFAVSYAWSLVTHLTFRRRVLAEAYDIADESTLSIWRSVCDELEYLRPTALLVSSALRSPLSMGRIKRTRCMVLPQREYSAEELRMIFLHEVHHLQRSDVDTKVFLTVIKCACWFNPFVWIAVNKAAQDLELSCDEIVTEKMTADEKRAYAELLLSSASEQCGFTTCLSASASALRYRLKSVMVARSRKLGKWVIMIAVFVSVLCYNVIAFSDSRGSLKSFAVPEDNAAVYYFSGNWKGLSSPDHIEDGFFEEIDRLLEETTVEHYLNSADIYSDEKRLGYIYVHESVNSSASRRIDIYDDHVTITELGPKEGEAFSETYGILNRHGNQ